MIIERGQNGNDWLKASEILNTNGGKWKINLRFWICQKPSRVEFVQQFDPGFKNPGCLFLEVGDNNCCLPVIYNCDALDPVQYICFFI